MPEKMHREPGGEAANRKGRDAGHENLVEAEISRIALDLADPPLQVEFPDRSVSILEIGKSDPELGSARRQGGASKFSAIRISHWNAQAYSSGRGCSARSATAPV